MLNLRNPFSRETKLLYLYRYDCDVCGSNRMLELHHITGRGSNSPLNASLVCHDCHATMCHSKEEEQLLFARNLRFLFNSQYRLTNDDLDFIKNNPRLVENNDILIKWLRQ